MALDASFTEIRAIERAVSLFDPTSDISRLNRDGRIDKADPRLLALLHASRQVADLTRRAFDITVQPYWLAWAGAQSGHAAPSDAALNDASSRVGQQHIVTEGESVRLTKSGMGITLNGIARGYATDRVMGILAGGGIAHAFVDTDSIGTKGRNHDTTWTLAIAHPREPGRLLGEIKPLNGFVSTSGDYEMAFSDDFRNNHIFVPATGRSPLELASATIIAPSGALADGLSTAAMVLGPERTLALVGTLPATHAVLVRKTGEVRVSAGAPFARSAA